MIVSSLMSIWLLLLGKSCKNLLVTLGSSLASVGHVLQFRFISCDPTFFKRCSSYVGAACLKRVSFYDMLDKLAFVDAFWGVLSSVCGVTLLS